MAAVVNARTHKKYTTHRRTHRALIISNTFSRPPFLPYSIQFIRRFFLYIYTSRNVIRLILFLYTRTFRRTFFSHYEFAANSSVTLIFFDSSCSVACVEHSIIPNSNFEYVDFYERVLETDGSFMYRCMDGVCMYVCV